jgi:hypothetical protein
VRVVERHHRERLIARIRDGHEREVDTQRLAVERHAGEHVCLGAGERREVGVDERARAACLLVMDDQVTMQAVRVDRVDRQRRIRDIADACAQRCRIADAGALPCPPKVANVTASGKRNEYQRVAHRSKVAPAGNRALRSEQMGKTWVVVVALLAQMATARADEPVAADPPADAPAAAPAVDPLPDPGVAPLHEDNEFGPVILIEAIEITGNTATQTEIIRRALPISPGDVLHASDKRLREARFKVLALGFFRDVTLAMRKGSARGQVVIDIHVVERGTFVLNRLWFGSTSVAPYWVGADIGDRNLLGLGISIGGGFVYAGHGEIAGSRDQWAGEVRLADGALRGTRWGANGSLTLVHGSEPYRIAGDSDDGSEKNFRAFSYRRFGGRFGVTYDASALSRLYATMRVEEISSELPVAPTQTLPDGRIVGVNLHLEPGDSRVITAGFGFDRDTRPDPILPHAGGRITLSAEIGSGALGGSYDFASLFGRYEHWWPLYDERQTIGLRLAGGVVIGNAPRFDLVHISDVDRMLTPRALGLVLSNASPLDVLGTRDDKPSYGQVASSATIEYAARVFRGSGKKRVYGGDIFVGAGLWELAEADSLRLRDTKIWDALPIDVYLDAGVRIDTDVGIFELTISNALGRLR